MYPEIKLKNESLFLKVLFFGLRTAALSSIVIEKTIGALPVFAKKQNQTRMKIRKGAKPWNK